MNHSPQGILASLILSIKDEGGNTLLQNHTAMLNLESGLNIYDLSDIAEAVKQLSNTESATPTEICMEVKAVSGEDFSIIASHCNRLAITTRISPYLTYPFDKEILNSSSVIFTWTPLLLTGCMPTYTLTIVEMGSSHVTQDISQTSLNRPPFFQQENMLSNSILYPAQAPVLEPGKQYAWFVQSMNEGRVISVTEVQTFSVQENQRKTAVQPPKELPFVDLKRKDDASIYPAKEAVRFKFPNRYGEVDFQLEVRASGGKVMEIRKEWLTDLGHGLYELELPLGGGFEPQTSYELHIYDKQQGFYRIKFRYLLKTRKTQN